VKEVVLFSIIKWCCFQLLKIKLNQPSGALFDYKMVLFSFVKNRAGFFVRKAVILSGMVRFFSER